MTDKSDAEPEVLRPQRERCKHGFFMIVKALGLGWAEDVATDCRLCNGAGGGIPYRLAEPKAPPPRDAETGRVIVDPVKPAVSLEEQLKEAREAADAFKTRCIEWQDKAAAFEKERDEALIQARLAQDELTQRETDASRKLATLTRERDEALEILRRFEQAQSKARREGPEGTTAT